MCARRKAADKKKVLFSDEFYSDMSAPDMLHAVLVRSPFSYGTIVAIDFAPKTKIPAGYALFTHKDFPCANKINILSTEIPVLCAGEIAYKGEPVALLVGADKEILSELKNSVRITLDKRELKKSESQFAKAYNSLSVSLKDGSPIEQSLTSLRNTLADFAKPKEIVARRKIVVGDVDEIFADEEKSAFVVEGTWKNSIRHESNKETEGVFCQLKGGNLHIFTPSQWISELQNVVSEVTGFEKEKIIITRTKISTKNTNSLWLNGIVSSLAALAALKTGNAVRLSFSREEQSDFLENPPDITITHKTALDKNGIISAMDIAIDYDAGAHNPFAAEILDRLSIAACGIYNCKQVRVNAKATKSHNPPSALPLAMSNSHSFFAMENQIQKIAEITGFSPIDLRQMNKAGGLHKVTKPFTFSFGRSSDAINAVAIRSDFKRKYAVSRLAEHGRHEITSNSPYSPPLRGIGISAAFEGSGYLGTNFEKMNISLHVSVSEEKKILVHAMPPSLSVREIWTKIIQDTLEIEKRNILFTGGFFDENTKKQRRSQIPESLTGDVSIKSVLLKKCVDSIKRKKMDSAPYSVRKTLSVSKKAAWNQEEFSGSPYYNTAFGTCTVELELDTCTFREKLRKICVIIDGGKILHPKAAENAIHRAITNCLSSLVSGDRLKCPAVSVQFMQSEEEPKQIGNLIYSLLPAAYTSALSQAISVTVEEVPLQTDSLYKIREEFENERQLADEDEQ